MYTVNYDKEKHNNAINLLQKCNKDLYPTIYKLLTIFCTIPVSTSTNERSFSTLRRLKTYKRSTMNENRLNGLATLNIHKEINLNMVDVINELSKQKRKMEIHI